MKDEMPAEWIPALAKAANDPGLIKEIYGDLAKPGVAQVGKALSTIIGLGNTCLWPIRLLNERARIALDSNLESFRERLSTVPEDKINPVSPELGVPIAEKLSYVTDKDIRELYLNLLTKACNTDTVGLAHPSFLNIINSISPDEAVLLRQLGQKNVTPYVGLKYSNPNSQHFHQVIEVHIALDEQTKLSFPWNLPAYISNLEGLGLIDVSLAFKFPIYSEYAALEAELRETYKDAKGPEGFTVLSFDQGRILTTQYSRLFLSACLWS